MKQNQLLDDIVLMVRGSNLPSTEEIKQMTFEEKIKYEKDQDYIIQIFRQQALLDITLLKIKISQLIEEVTKLRIHIIQQRKTSNNISNFSRKNQGSIIQKNDIKNKKENMASIENAFYVNSNGSGQAKILTKNKKNDFKQEKKNQTSGKIKSNDNKTKKTSNSTNINKYMKSNRKKKPRIGYFNFSSSKR